MQQLSIVMPRRIFGRIRCLFSPLEKRVSED